MIKTNEARIQSGPASATDTEYAAYLRVLADDFAKKTYFLCSSHIRAIADRLDPPPKMVTISWEQVAPVMPVSGSEYWILASSGNSSCWTWDGGDFDQQQWANGNVYLTQEDSKAAAAARKAAVAKVMA